MKYRLLSILKYRALNRSLALGAGLLLLGACSGFGLYDARDAQPSGTAFENALYSEYMTQAVGSSRVDLQACKLEYSIVSPK